jgi:hypothetical protein
LFKFGCFQFQNAFYGDAKDWARRIFAFFIPNVPRVMNPHNKLVQQWNKFFAICCLVAIFVDPLFLFLLSVNKVWFFFSLLYIQILQFTVLSICNLLTFFLFLYAGT